MGSSGVLLCVGLLVPVCSAVKEGRWTACSGARQSALSGVICDVVGIVGVVGVSDYEAGSVLRGVLVVGVCCPEVLWIC